VYSHSTTAAGSSANGRAPASQRYTSALIASDTDRARVQSFSCVPLHAGRSSGSTADPSAATAANTLPDTGADRWIAVAAVAHTATATTTSSAASRA
jgi:hypothetical protein